MADKTLNVTISGAEDLFKGMDASLSKLSASLDAVTKQIEKQSKATVDLAKKQKKGKVQSGQMMKQWKNLGSKMAVSKVSMKGVGKALGSTLIPAFSKLLGPLGMVSGAIKQLYELFLGYNKRLTETGDVMGHLDLRMGDSYQAFNKLNNQITDMQATLWKSGSTTKEYLETLKGFGTAGLMVSDLAARLGGLRKASKIVTTYSKLFTMDTTEMATHVGAFTRELNLSATASTAAFSEIYNASLDARYGTSNFLRIVNQAVPSIANFGGSISEVSRFLQIMGNTGVISMRQAKDTIGAMVTGIKNMTMEQRLSASAFVDQNDMIKLIQSRLVTVQKQTNMARKDEKAFMILRMQQGELERDLTAAISGDRLAMARTMKRWGAAETMEFTFMQAEKIMGQQLKSLQDITKISAKDEYLLTGILREQGMTEQTLEVLKRLGAGDIKHGGKTIKTLEDLYKAMRESDEFNKNLQEQLASDEESADMIRNKTLDKIETTLEIIKNQIAKSIVPAADAVIKWVASLNIPGIIDETGNVISEGLKYWGEKFGLSTSEAKKVEKKDWSRYSKQGFISAADRAKLVSKISEKGGGLLGQASVEAKGGAAAQSRITELRREIAERQKGGYRFSFGRQEEIKKLQAGMGRGTESFEKKMRTWFLTAAKESSAGKFMPVETELLKMLKSFMSVKGLTQNINIAIKGENEEMIRTTLDRYFKQFAEKSKAAP